jgi:hypothetical protein
MRQGRSEQMNIDVAYTILSEAGGEVRLQGGGLIDDPPQRMEVRPKDRSGDWEVISELCEAEVDPFKVWAWARAREETQRESGWV